MNEAADTEATESLPENEEPREEATALPAAKPRRLRPVAAPVQRDAGIFGLVPPSADRFKLQKLTVDGGYQPVTFRSADGGAELDMWPIEDLTIDKVRERHGEGDFRASFMSGGGRRFVAHSPIARIRVPVQAAPPPAPSLSDPMTQMLAMMRIADDRAAQHLSSVVALASQFGANRAGAGGIDAEKLQLILEKQQLANQMVIAEMRAEAREERATHLRQMEELKKELLESEASDIDAAAVASAGAKVYRRGMSAWDLAKAMMAEHPEILKDALAAGTPLVLGILNKVAEAQQQKAAQAAQQQAAHVRRLVPRSVPAPVREAPPQAPSPPRPSGPGLNGANLSPSTPETPAPPSAPAPPSPPSA